MKIGVFVTALLSAAALSVPMAWSYRTADSPACVAAKQRVKYDTDSIATVVKQLNTLSHLTNTGSVQATRQKQLNTRKTQLEADLVTAKAAMASACGQAPSFDGSWTATVSGRLNGNVAFTVANSVISGGMTGTIDKNGDASVTSNGGVPGAVCQGKVHFAINGSSATVSSQVNGISCTLQGQNGLGTLQGQKGH